MNSITIKQLRVISAALLLAGLSSVAIGEDVRSGTRDVNQVFGRASAIPASWYGSASSYRSRRKRLSARLL